MAVNDYYVIVYQILAYLYHCLKEGEEVSIIKLAEMKNDMKINDRYWQYILKFMRGEGLIDGLCEVPIVNSRYAEMKLQPDFMITPKGIAYLEENSMMTKAKKALSEIKNFVPLLPGLFG